jgi:hypothetical protein
MNPISSTPEPSDDKPEPSDDEPQRMRPTPLDTDV